MPVILSQRGRECLAQERQEFFWLRASRNRTVIRNDGIVEWWTFAGRQLNSHLGDTLGKLTGERPSFDNFRLLVRASDASFVGQTLGMLATGHEMESGPVNSRAMMKFSELLPPEFRHRLVHLRNHQGLAIGAFLSSIPSSPNP
jgi:hypothetical protein